MAVVNGEECFVDVQGFTALLMSDAVWHAKEKRNVAGLETMAQLADRADRADGLHVDGGERAWCFGQRAVGDAQRACFAAPKARSQRAHVSQWRPGNVCYGSGAQQGD